jgi:hypothetical protein
MPDPGCLPINQTGMTGYGSLAIIDNLLYFNKIISKQAGYAHDQSAQDRVTLNPASGREQQGLATVVTIFE